MAGRRHQTLGAGDRLGERGGRGRRHDAVAPGYDDQRGHIEVARAYRYIVDPPLTARRRVVTVPIDQTLTRDRRGQRDAVVEPVLQRDEEFGLVARRIEAREGAELVGDHGGVEAR